MQPEAADELAGKRMFEVDEVVVITLEQVPFTVAPDDPVQHDRVEHLVVVGDDFADVVAALRANDREIAGVKPRLHADPVGHHVRRRATD